MKPEKQSKKIYKNLNTENKIEFIIRRNLKLQSNGFISTRQNKTKI